MEAPSGPAPGPSPREIEALAWSAIDEAARKRRCPGARGLHGFVQSMLAGATPKHDERTNIIDQGERITYAFTAEQQHALFRHLEACRLEGSVTHFSERQGTIATPKSGLMLDYDIVTRYPAPILTDRHCYRIAGSLAAALQRDIDFASQIGGKRQAEHKIHMFFIVKTAATPLAAAAASAAQYKYGMHVLVPGVKLARSCKKWLLRRFRGEAAVAAVLEELGAEGDASACLDQNSAAVPVLFFGSCKRGGAPYVLAAALEVAVDLAATASPAIVKPIAAETLRNFNLVAELSLALDADYGNDQKPLITKLEFECRPEVGAAALDWSSRAAAGAISDDELLLAEHSLSTLTLHDAEAKQIHALLDLLGEEYYTDRNRWRDVIFALANTSAEYKPLAVWFSHKCPQKWADGGVAALDAVWDDAVGRRHSVERPIGLPSISYWARDSNPAHFAEVMAKSYFTMLTSYVYDHGGKLQHYMIAKILHLMLGSKFIVDIEPGPRGSHYTWFEFVLPGQRMLPGEVWKWRREAEPDDVHVYMSEKLPHVFDQVTEHLEERRAAAVDEGQAKYYVALAKAFAASKLSLYNDAFKNSTIKQASYLFRRRGFSSSLDRMPFLFGVSNGVLRLGRRLELIANFHEHPVSRFTPVVWRPFDPEEPWTRLALKAIADIVVEPDARDWILFHAAQGLSGGAKEGLLLLWEGGGENGKTTFLRMVAKALGPYADKYNIQLMSSEREEADRPNSAMMKFKHLNYAYCEETNKAQVLNSARMKEMVNAGEVSGRDLQSKQETFTMRCNFVAASQFSFIIDTTDHGTWRRLRHYNSKPKFRTNPDPANPLEKKADQRYNMSYPEDPQFQTAVLSILGHYYERLQAEYGGQLKNMRAPTIERETEVFRVSQDSLHRWICETIVVAPGWKIDYPVGILGIHFSEWYGRHIDRKRHVAGGIIKEIEASVVGKYLKPAANGTMTLRGCRLLLGEDTALREGEEFLSAIEMRGGRSLGEWNSACKGAQLISSEYLPDGLPWWAARAAPRKDNVGADDDSWFDLAAAGLDDSAALLRGEYAALRPADRSATDEEVNEFLDLALADWPKYSCEDLYGS